MQSRAPCRVRTRRADLCLKSLDINCITRNLEAAGYKISGPVNLIDQTKDKDAGTGVDYSVKDINKSKDYEIQATKLLV